MTTLAATSLTEAEKRAVEHFAQAVAERFGAEFDSLWLYGSRARGEAPHPESDVDLMLLLAEPSSAKHLEAIGLMHDAQDRLGAPDTYFSVKLYDRPWVEGRRAIESFFLAEVDRDKVVIRGQP